MRSGVLEPPPRSIPSKDFLNGNQQLIQASFPSPQGKRTFDQANIVSNTGKKGHLIIPCSSRTAC